MTSGRAFPPVVLALLLQVAALLVVLPAGLLLHDRFPLLSLSVFLIGLTLLQGAIAALLSRWCRMPWWWQAIQFGFPVAVVVARVLAMPPWFSLAAFLLLWLTYWSVARTRVPLYVCGPAVWQAVSEMLPRGSFRFLDVGSGLGGLVLHLAASHPLGRCEGVEIAPLPWLISTLRAMRTRARGGRCRFFRDDYRHRHLGREDVVFAFLSPVAMPALWDKACAEMGAGALLLSLEFPVPGVVPDVRLPIGDEGGGGRTLFGYRMKGAAVSERA